MTPETTDRPVIALTMGDPAGIGPELCLKALAEPELARRCRPVVVGSREVLQVVADVLGLEAGWPVLDAEADREALASVAPAVVDLPVEGLDPSVVGRVEAACGRASAAYIQWAIDAARGGVIDAMATAPINKKSLQLAGVPYPGHTEMLAAGCGVDEHDVVMMLTSPEITVSLVTTHVAMDRVPGMITSGRIARVVELTVKAMRRIRRREPRLVVCAYNPHGGEQGLFGEVDHLVIEPAVEAARRQGVLIEGPLPADTAFTPAVLGRADAHVVMYHDQGLIPFKMLAFDHGVNVTLGLPIVRTSVDHGTAFDIARRGQADAGSLSAAVELAVDLVG